MGRIENVLTVFGFALIVSIVVAQAGGGPGLNSLVQLIQLILEILSEFAFLFDDLFGGGLLFV